VCQDCSVGCNVDVFSQRDQILRLTPRENHDVNGYFMCDIGRYGFHRFEEIERVTQPMVRNGESFDALNWDKAIEKTADLIKKSNGKTAGIVSPFHTNESNFLLGLMMNGVLGSLPPITKKEITYQSGFRISADRSPNRRGMNNICGEIVADLPSEIKAQAIHGLYILDDGVDRESDDVWKEILAKMDFVVVQTYAMTALARSANIILPGLAPFEREGTITNDRDRVQWLRSSLPRRGMNYICGEIVADLPSEIKARAIHGLYILDDGVDRESDDVWKEILAKMDFVVVQTYAMTALARSANIILPGLAPFEREGTITNDRDRVQWLRSSLPKKGESRADWEILMMVMKALDKEEQTFADVGQVIKVMGEKFPAYKGLSFFRLGPHGMSLNGKASG